MFVPVADVAGVIEQLAGARRRRRAPPDELAPRRQIRLWWDRNPVDLFFSYDPFHDAAATRPHVPFADN